MLKVQLPLLALTLTSIPMAQAHEGREYDWEYFRDSKQWSLAPQQAVFFPSEAPLSNDRSEGSLEFNLHETVFGDAKGTIVGHYGSIQAPAQCKGDGQLTCILPSMLEASILTSIHVLGTESAFHICTITPSAQNPLAGSTIFGNKPWTQSPETPCAQNIIAVRDGKDQLGAISLSPGSAIITKEWIKVGSPFGFIDFKLRVPYSGDLHPNIRLLTNDKTLPEIQILSIDSKWPLPVSSGYNDGLSGDEVRTSYINPNDDLTAVHNYSLSWEQTENGLVLRWYLEGFLYLTETIMTINEFPAFQLNMSLDRQSIADPSIPITDGMMTIFDITIHNN